MKKLLLASLLALQLVCVKAQTNVYHPLLDTSSLWNVSIVDHWNYQCKDGSFFIKGDTILAGKKYKKLFYGGVDYGMMIMGSFVWCQSNITNTTFGFHSALREDTITKKVYKYNTILNKEYLIYDFSLKAGDTLSYDAYSMFPRKIPVLKVDSILIGSSYRKRWHLRNIGWSSMDIIYIEGIGQIDGLMEPLYTIEKRNTRLDCYSFNNVGLYPISSYSFKCKYYTSIEQVQIDEFDFIISPNPSNGVFKIETNTTEKINLEITDVFGRLIQRIEMSNQILQLDLSNENNGIYFVRVMDEKGNPIVKKIIKQ